MVLQERIPCSHRVGKQTKRQAARSVTNKKYVVKEKRRILPISNKEEEDMARTRIKKKEREDLDVWPVGSSLRISNIIGKEAAIEYNRDLDSNISVGELRKDQNGLGFPYPYWETLFFLKVFWPWHALLGDPPVWPGHGWRD